MSRLARKHLQYICILLSLFVVSAWGQVNVDPKKGRVTGNPMSGNRYTIEQEIKIGREGMADVEKKLPILPASHPMSKYVNNLGQQLAAKAPGYKFPYTFKVVRDKSINAFALPGGPIYVHTGLIEAANESELAGVMGHEISHVVMRHSTRQASRAMKTQLPLAILGGVLGAGVGGWAGALGQMGISLTAGTVLMKYSRDSETEADMVGGQIMYDAGHDPQAMITFFNQLKQQQGKSGGPQFLASHPDPGNRAQNVSKILSRFPPKTFHEGDSPEYLAAKKALSEPEAASGEAAEKPADMPRLSVQDIATADFTTYRATAYSISYPDNWHVSDAGSSVSIYPEGGSANGALAYGVMISGFEPKNKTKELDNALGELTADIQMANPGLRIANSPQVFTVQGLPARKLDWFGTSAVREDGKTFTERVRLVAIQTKSGVVLYLVFVAPDDDFQGLWPVFEKMLDSLQVR